MLCRDKIRKKNLNKKNIVAINKCAKWIKCRDHFLLYVSR